jgi:hypothetical protein
MAKVRQFLARLDLVEGFHRAAFSSRRVATVVTQKADVNALVRPGTGVLYQEPVALGTVGDEPVVISFSV